MTRPIATQGHVSLLHLDVALEGGFLPSGVFRAMNFLDVISIGWSSLFPGQIFVMLARAHCQITAENQEWLPSLRSYVSSGVSPCHMGSRPLGSTHFTLKRRALTFCSITISSRSTDTFSPFPSRRDRHFPEIPVRTFRRGVFRPSNRFHPSRTGNPCILYVTSPRAETLLLFLSSLPDLALQ